MATRTKARFVEPMLLLRTDEFEFVEWTTDNHLRHSRSIALREDRAARGVGREQRL